MHQHKWIRVQAHREKEGLVVHEEGGKDRDAGPPRSGDQRKEQVTYRVKIWTTGNRQNDVPKVYKRAYGWVSWIIAFLLVFWSGVVHCLPSRNFEAQQRPYDEGDKGNVGNA